MKLTKLITFRSLNTRRLRSFLTIFGIVLGVAGMYSINSANESAYLSITRLFEGTSGRISLEVKSSATGGVIPLSYLDTISEIEGVEVATPVIKIPAVISGEEVGGIDLNFFGTGAGGFMVYGIDVERDREIRDYRLTDGRFLQSNNLGKEIVLVEDYAKENDLQVGDTMAVVTSFGPVELVVSGLISKEGPGLINFGKIGFMNLEEVQILANREQEADQIDIAVLNSTEDQNIVKDTKARIEEILEEGYTVLYPDNQGDRMTQMLGGYQIGLNFMAGIALFVGAFLIYNAFSMTVVERTREIGLLRSIGMSSLQVFWQVIVEGLILGIAGGILGVLLGIVLSRGLAGLMSGFLGYDIDFSNIPINILIASSLLGVVVALLASVLPAIKAGRISPLEALRIRGMTDEGFLTKYGWLFGIGLLVISTWILILNPFPYDVQFRLGSFTVFALFLGATLIIPVTIKFWQFISRYPIKIIFSKLGEFGIRNIERAKKRTMLTCASIMIGVSMIVVIQGITGAFTKDLYDWMDSYIGGDIFVSAAVPMEGNLKDKLEGVEGIRTAAPMRYIDIKWTSEEGIEEKLFFLAVDVDSYSEITGFVFNDPKDDTKEVINSLADEQSIFISSVISEKYGLIKGDSMAIETLEGVKDFKIAAVILDFYNQGMVVTGNWQDLNKYFSITDANTFLVKVESGANIDEVIGRINSDYKEEYQLITESNSNLKDRARSLMNQAFSMFDVLGIIAVSIAALGVMNTLFMNVSERTREIAMLRSIGMARFQVIKIILAEAMFLGIIGGVMGIGFGLVLTRIILLSMGAMSGYALDFVFPINAVWIGILIAVVMSQLAALLPALKAARTPMLDAIRYE
jgi:putative ABC transport system permease protein